MIDTKNIGLPSTKQEVVESTFSKLTRALLKNRDDDSLEAILAALEQCSEDEQSEILADEIQIKDFNHDQLVRFIKILQGEASNSLLRDVLEKYLDDGKCEMVQKIVTEFVDLDIFTEFEDEIVKSLVAYDKDQNLGQSMSGNSAAGMTFAIMMGSLQSKKNTDE